MRFRVEHVQWGQPACVVARQLDEGDFRVAAGSRLGDVELLPIASQARAGRIYAFWLKTEADWRRFEVGQEVELRPSAAK
jgi:hypothetical protein